jgi:SAM-dependent methyltransferase
MASIKDNLSYWGDLYDWPSEGDEWSGPWGDADSQWRATLLPRVWPFLPSKTVLEIAPGYGRWSQYLIGASKKYIGVDLAESCVEKCRERFKDADHAEFHANDGKSLAVVEDDSIDFLFSFDSLVHVEEDAIAAYLREFARTLTADGVAFIHHSNLGEYRSEASGAAALSKLTSPVPIAQKILRRAGLIDWHQSRAPSMSAGRWVELCEAAGLVCVGQEIINWAKPQFTDCISLVARPGSRWARPNVVVRNPHFMAEAGSTKSLSEIFTSLSRGGSELQASA